MATNEQQAETPQVPPVEIPKDAAILPNPEVPVTEQEQAKRAFTALEKNILQKLTANDVTHAMSIMQFFASPELGNMLKTKQPTESNQFVFDRMLLILRHYVSKHYEILRDTGSNAPVQEATQVENATAQQS